MEARSRTERTARAYCDAIEFWSSAIGQRLDIDTSTLHERTGLFEPRSSARISANGRCRLYRARDRWVAINLARPDDEAMVPALLGRSSSLDPWSQLDRAVPRMSSATLLAQGRLLGLAVSTVGEVRAESVTAAMRQPRAPHDARPWTRRPVVVDMAALWAGPLCGALLAKAACDVVKVQFRSRPEPETFASDAFHRRLNAGKRSCVLDPAMSDDRRQLDELLRTADVIISSARRRGLASLGIEPERYVRADARPIWVAISGYGIRGVGMDRIGFGDDCAVAGGLVCSDAAGRPGFVGDAVADPLTGLRAAAAAFEALAKRRGGLLDLSLAETAAAASAMWVGRHA